MHKDGHPATASGVDAVRAVLLSSTTHSTHSRASTEPSLDQQRENDRGDSSRAQSRNRDSDLGLPSVVHDSQEITDDTKHRAATVATTTPDAVQQLRAMNTQVDSVNGTQLISQSIYRSIIEKARSTRHDGQEALSETQRTYEDGDSGHVDITSSFVTRHEQPEEPDHPADSDPVNFSPASSYHQLTQFPESQRFKTPATTGKKRNYNGDVIATPAPFRNPLARDDQTTPSEMLGLSQAFAATQAPSSPFSNGLPTVPKSDRPSPTVELQTRLATGTSSSPLLRPITDLKRAATEPASRYVPMRQSQADREQQERLHLLQDMDKTDDQDDDFADEDSAITRKRRQREREDRAKEELKSLSSPIMAPQPLPDSSPPRLALPSTDTEEPDDPSTTPMAMNTVQIDDDSTVLASEAEAEAEQVENAQLETYSLSWRPEDDDEEDKENMSVLLVPKTIQKQRPRTESVIAHIDASPSLRHTTNTPTTRGVSDIVSSGQFRIVDSQASQTRSRFVNSEKIASSASDVIDFGEHPAYVSNLVDSGVSANRISRGYHEHSPAPAVESAEHEVDIDTTVTTSSAKPALSNSVPETSSEIRAGRPASHSIIDLSSNGDRESTTATRTEFETAQSHIEPKISTQASQMSSPIRTTPPGRKRRRMLDISAENSPWKPHSQPMFDAEAILQLDADQQTAALLESSPHRRAYRHRQDVGEVAAASSGQEHNQSDSVASMDEESDVDVHPHRQNPSAGSSPLADVDPPPQVSQDIVRLGRRSHLQLGVKSAGIQDKSRLQPHTSTRQSIFDIVASQEERIVPQLQHKVRADNRGSKKNARPVTVHKSRMERRIRSEIPPNNDSMLPQIITTSDDRPIEPKTTDIEVSNAQNATPPGSVVAHNMVFAYYKGDPRGYYPAKLLGNADDGAYHVQWEGYEPEIIDAFGVKALDLHKGDTIKVLADGFKKIPYIVQDFKDRNTEASDVTTDIRGYRTLIIIPKQRKSYPTSMVSDQPCEVPVGSIYLDVNMWAQLKSRTHKFGPIASSAVASSITTPLYRASSPMTPSSRDRRQVPTTFPLSTAAGQGVFLNMAFAMSYDDTPQKNLLSNQIQSNGGMIIYDSFDDLLETDAIRLKPRYAGLEFTALLTDRHSRKEKFMQALALGVPCLSGKWIEACVKRKCLVDWQSYLLPAGESAELDNATKSRILPPVYSSTIKLDDMLNMRPKLLEGTNVVVVVGRGKVELKRVPYVFLIRALGASQISKVSDLKSAADFLKSEQGKQCQWVFADDKDVPTLQTMVDDETMNQKTGKKDKTKARHIPDTVHCRVAGNELIVQSLILGRLFEA